MALGKDSLSVGSKKFPCAVVTAERNCRRSSSWVPARGDELPVIGRRAIEPGASADGLTPDSRTPSALVLGAPAEASADVTVEDVR